MRGYKISPWSVAPEGVQNAAGEGLFKEVVLDWRKPTLWAKSDACPTFDTDEPFLYALIRDHGNLQSRDRIVYIGLTKAPRTRFGNHKTARSIVARRGTVRFTYAPIDWIQGKNRLERVGRAMEELEHLLIWALPNEPLENQRKQFTLPGLGANGGNAWHIRNKGHRFGGRMPQEIVFPWMVVRPGRDRTRRKTT